MTTTNTDKYRIINDICYKREALDTVVQVLENARRLGTRIAIIYGDIKTGKAWNKGEPCLGYIGKNSSGLPILLPGKTSIGGQCIMDASILGIKEAKGGKILYIWLADETLIVEEKLVEQVSDTDNMANVLLDKKCAALG